MTTSRPFRGSAAGFTLVEVLVAASLFGLLLLALPKLLVTAIAANAQARDMTAGLSLAQSKLEELRAQTFADVASGVEASMLDADGAATDIAGFSRSWTVSTGPISGTKEIRVDVTWNHGRSHAVALRTIIWE